VFGDNIVKFCVTVGFEASSVLKKTYPTIRFTQLNLSDIKWQNTNYCLQHGDFLQAIDAKDNDLIIFTDADIVMQRTVSSLDYSYLASLEPGEICLGMNSGESDNLLREHLRLEALAGKEFQTPHSDIIEAKYGVNLVHLPCYNTGVMAAFRKDYQFMFDEYLKEIAFVDKAYGHYAKQQWLMGLIANTKMKVLKMPQMIHTHGHAGIPPNVDFHKDVAFVEIQLFGNTETKIEVLFRHHLEQPKKLIKLAYADDGGCVWYRMIMPHQALKKAHPTLYEVVGDFKYTQEELQKASIVVVQRSQDINHLLNMNNWKSPKTKLIWDGDDDYLRVDDNNPMGHGSMNPENVTGLNAWLKGVDAITVSTEYLKNYYLEAVKTKVPIYVMPNSIDFKVWDFHHGTRKEISRNKEYVVIGWHGGCSHQTDFEEAHGWIYALAKKYYGKIRFAAVGYNFFDLPQYEGGGIRSMVDHYDWSKDTVNFGRNLVMFDIGIAPLSKGVPFNLSKSNIKFLEYSALGIPTVATDIEPYKEIINGETGFKVDNSVDAWVDCISRLIEDAGLRDRIGENARAFVKKNYNLALEGERRHKIYEEILAGGSPNDNGRCDNPVKV
jgi:hypothetical protein